MADGISLGSLWNRSGHSGHPGANIPRSLSVERTDCAEYSIFKVLKYFLLYTVNMKFSLLTVSCFFKRRLPGCGSTTGFGVSPKFAFGYPNAMLAKRVPPVSVSPGRPASDLFRFFDLYQSIECRTNDMESVCHTDFGIHCSCHFFSAYNDHPASPQKDMGHPSIPLHIFRISFFEER